MASSRVGINGQPRELPSVLEGLKEGLGVGAEKGKSSSSLSSSGAYLDGASGGPYSPPPPSNSGGPYSPPPPPNNPGNNKRNNDTHYSYDSSDHISLHRVDVDGMGGPTNFSNFGREEDAVSDRLSVDTTLQQLLRGANVNPDADLGTEIMTIVNGRSTTHFTSTFIGTIIEPGKLGILSYDGQIEVVAAGRWSLFNVRAKWEKIVNLTDNPIQYETLTIVRVMRGQYGLAMDNGKPVILDEGVHVKNTRVFQHKAFVASNTKHIKHETIHILIVPSSEYALVVENNIPKILKSGMYVIDSSFFTVAGFVNVNSPHIEHYTLHIVRVPKGKVALISENNKYALLPQGTYTFNTQVFQYSGLKDITETVITHGTITRFRVRNGELGLAWNDNKPIYIEQASFYEIDSPNFTFVKCVPASEKQVTLGSRKRIIVYDGEVGISYVNGKLDVLKPKTHIFDDAERIFFGFLSTRQQSLYLVEDDAKDHFLRCDTKDFVEVGLKACVFYKISDPEKCLLNVGDEKTIAKLIKDTSIATLQSIMRSSGLNQVAQSKHVHAKVAEEPSPMNEGPSAPLFFDKVHDEFIFHLHDTFYKMYGIEIANIRIESFKIMNHALADNISQQAIITAQTETKLANLEGQHEIATAEMQRESEVIRIKTQAAAKQLATEAEARNSSIVADARGKAEAAKIVAQGEADSLLIKAEAEAKAIELKAAAERKRAEELSATPLGEKLAMMTVNAQMVTESLKGVQKIIYLPSNANLAQTPIQLFGVPGLGAPALDESLLESDQSTSSTSTRAKSQRQNKS